MEALVFKNHIPDSILPYPKGFWLRVKYIFWRAISPGYTSIQHALLDLHVIHHGGRQGYFLGKLKDGKTLKDFLDYLEAEGFGNNFIAWTDGGQIISMRKPDGFERQYHIRIFRDREIRGHYEYTPESHPSWHMGEVRMEQRRKKFIEFLGDWIVSQE